MKMKNDKDEIKNNRRITKSPIAKIHNDTLHSPSTTKNFNIKETKDVSPSLSEKIMRKSSNKNKLIDDDRTSCAKRSKRRNSNSSNNEELLIDTDPINYESLNDISFIDTVELLLEQDSEYESDDNFEFCGSSSKLFNDSVDNVASLQASASFNAEMKTQCNDSNVFEVEDGKLIIMKQNIIYLHGVTKLTVVKGHVEILGYGLEENKPYDVYSPRGSSFLYIKKLPHESRLNITTVLKLLNTKLQLVKDFLKQVNEDDALIFCQLVNNRLISTLEKYVPHQLFPKNDLKFKLVDNLKDVNVINISPAWNDLIQYVKTDSRILISGGKSVGKSTLLRYMINKLLRRYKKILVVDLDPGQAEFTVPGCVSSTFVTTPLLGPNYTHLCKPDRCFYISNISILQSPLEYIRCIKKLMSYYENFAECPMIINSMGYGRNLASELISSVIAISSPSIIFQIDSQNYVKNCNVKFDLNTINKNLKFFTSDLEIKRNFKIFNTDAPSDECVAWICGPRQLREMCIFSYFSQMLGKTVSFTDGEVPTYMISLSSINVISPNVSNPLVAANGNLVSLCSIVVDNDTESTTMYECHGWGIVRAIDLTKDILYLNTPIDRDVLVMVKYLIMGSVKIPSAVYTTIDVVDCIHPYVSHGFESIFSQIPKRAFIPKK